MKGKDVVRLCPTCEDNLYTQDGPPCAYIEQNTLWLYHCTACGQFSVWDPSPPVPIYLGPPTHLQMREYLTIQR